MTKEKRYFWGSIIIALLLTVLIVLLDPFISDVDLLPDSGSNWYYWQLPIRNAWIMLLVWMLFFSHLIGNFILIKKRLSIKKLGFHKYNLFLLLWNLLFIIIHYKESALFYDGLAQDVPIWSSQYSVIALLILLIVMQVNTRGVFLGYKIKLAPKANKFLFAIHGLLFTIATVYTFWFHPIINTIGHLTGFFYMFLLLIQISFLKTKTHYNKKWILFLEVLVALHGASVAYFVQNSSLWSMFLFGFLFIFFMTQIYSLNLKKFPRLVMQVLFLFCVFIYYLSYDISKIHQILWIPVIEYAGVFAIITILFLIFNKNKT